MLLATTPAQLAGFFNDRQEGAADRIEIHQAVNGLLSPGDPVQIIFPERPHPSGADLRHHVAQSADATVASSQHVVGKVVIKAGINLKGGDL